NGVATFLQVSELRRRIFWRRVDKSDRDHRGQATRVTAGVKEIETDLFSRRRSHVGRGMPRINRRRNRRGLILFGRVPYQIVEFAVGRSRSEIKLAEGVAHTVPLVLGAVRVTRV